MKFSEDEIKAKTDEIKKTAIAFGGLLGLIGFAMLAVAVLLKRFGIVFVWFVVGIVLIAVGVYCLRWMFYKVCRKMAIKSLEKESEHQKSK